MNFKHLETKDKLRGGFYTPKNLAVMLSFWALENGAKRVLEPGCGDGEFLRAINNCFNSESFPSISSMDAVEIVHEEAEKAKNVAQQLAEKNVQVTVHETDFLEWIVNKSDAVQWDAIVGNPPYIRYQYFDEKQRSYAEQIFKKASLPFTKRTNAWVPFVIASIMHLSPNGRLAMVLPAELLHILHANGLRRMLEQEMDEVDIIDVREMAFKKALQGIILLRAIKKGPNGERLNKESKAHFNIQTLNNIGDLPSVMQFHQTLHNSNNSSENKWTHWLLEEKELAVLSKVKGSGWTNEFRELASVDIGIVTGANKFFVVDYPTAKKYELLHITLPMLARSEFINGITYSLEDQKNNEINGKPVLFLRFPNLPKNQLPEKMADYITLGENQSLHTRYKCRIREPWYVVPYVWAAELSLLKRCHDFPRLVLNIAHAYSTDTAYRIIMNEAYKGREKDLIFSFLNSLTLLYAELEGRHYGGGVLELVPSEIEILPIPLVKVSDEQFITLDMMVRSGASLNEILNFTDPIILGVGSKAKLSSEEISIIRQARNRLRIRRMRSLEQ